MWLLLPTLGAVVWSTIAFSHAEAEESRKEAPATPKLAVVTIAVSGVAIIIENYFNHTGWSWLVVLGGFVWLIIAGRSKVSDESQNQVATISTTSSSNLVPPPATMQPSASASIAALPAQLGPAKLKKVKANVSHPWDIEGTVFDFDCWDLTPNGQVKVEISGRSDPAASKAASP